MNSSTAKSPDSDGVADDAAIRARDAVPSDDLHALMLGLMRSLTSAIGAKDAYTCGHSERVALLSRHLATQLGLSDAAADRIYLSGLLHDVGKIGVPEAVLQKPGKLTRDEFEQVRKHPEIGVRILIEIKRIEDIIPGVLHHHERYDGHGYPGRLSGKDIPLMGRIICLADCFDAMTSDRPYCKALSSEAALGEIRRCAGTQFDPELAETFLKLRPEQIHLLLSDHEDRSRKMLSCQESLKAA